MLLAGTGRQATRDVIALSRAVARAGADAVLVLTPSVYRNQLTPATLLAHYRAIADGSPVPVVLYNMPQATGVTLSPAIVQELATHPNIAASRNRAATSPWSASWSRACQPASRSSSARRPRSTQLAGRRHWRHRRPRQVVPELCVRLYDWPGRPARRGVALQRVSRRSPRR